MIHNITQLNDQLSASTWEYYGDKPGNQNCPHRILQKQEVKYAQDQPSYKTAPRIKITEQERNREDYKPMFDKAMKLIAKGCTRAGMYVCKNYTAVRDAWAATHTYQYDISRADFMRRAAAIEAEKQAAKAKRMARA